MHKDRTPSENQIAPKEKQKNVAIFFCFKIEAIVQRNLRVQKSVKKVEKSSFIQKVDIRLRHLQLYFWK